jgi:hypothetical protein
MSDWKETPKIEESPATKASPPFDWEIVNGAEAWTSNPDEIAGLSDPPIIDGLLREREAGTIVGAAKSNKTWFALALALAVASGKPFLGMATHRRKVLYLDYELKPGTLRKRVSMVAGEKPEGFFYVTLRGAARLPTLDEIRAKVEAEGFGLVVVDSLYRTGWLSEENNNDTTSRELSVLHDFTRKVACSIVAVDHTAKGGGNERSAVDAARGASAKAGFWDCLMVLRPSAKGPDPKGNYVMLDPVMRDWPRFESLPLMQFEWGAARCSVTAAGEVDRDQPSAVCNQILQALTDFEAGLSIPDLARQLGIPQSTVRRHTESMGDRLNAVQDPKHRQRVLYRLPDLADSTDEPHQTPPNPTR